ncbi:MAG: hypothetical protein ACSLFD_05225, partial [Solirubrobacterales bacterium]
MAQSQRVIQQSEKRDADQVDDPPPQVGFEQVEPRPLVEDGQRRKRDEGRGDQNGPQREGEDFAPVVIPDQSRADQAPAAGRDDQQRDGNCDRKSQPGDASALLPVRLLHRQRLEQLGQQPVRPFFHAERALGPGQRVDQTDLARGLVEVVDARKVVAVEVRDRGRVGVDLFDPDDRRRSGFGAVDQAGLEGRGLFGLRGLDLAGLRAVCLLYT